jgi:predicted DNA binding CopG/RHH family protein
MAKLITEMTKQEIDEIVERQLLDPEEQEIEDALAAGLCVTDDDLPARIEEWKEAARNTYRKKPVTLRMTNLMIGQLKRKANEEGMPYQTLMNSVLHKYLSGQLKERD